MSLTSLPPEIISCIVANIPSRHTRCSLARCSHQLYLCVVPHLYRNVSIYEDLCMYENFGSGMLPAGPLRPLASLLIRRPDLAGLVRHFEISSPPMTTEEFEGEFRGDRTFTTPTYALSLSTEEKINCLRQFPLSHRSYYDIVLALLLPALLKVETLALDVGIPWNTHYLEQMIQWAALREKPFDVQLPFEALKTLTYKGHILDRRHTGFIASLLKLPAIQKISVKPWNYWDQNDDDHIPLDKTLQDLDSSSSSVTILDLYVDELNVVDLGHIFRAPKALKCLFYRVLPAPSIDFIEVRDALASQESCLETLSLTCDRDFWTETEKFGSMPSFINFNTLERFQISAPLLAMINTTRSSRDSLIDIFPPSLVMLYLSNFSKLFTYTGLLESLEHLLAQKSPQQIPSLKKLILDEGESYFSLTDGRFGIRPADQRSLLWADTQKPAIERLVRVAAAQGVSVDVQHSKSDLDYL